MSTLLVEGAGYLQNSMRSMFDREYWQSAKKCLVEFTN